MIENNHFKDSLADRIKQDVIEDIVSAKLRNLKLKTGNKASELRRHSAVEKIERLNSEHWTNNNSISTPIRRNVASNMVNNTSAGITEGKLSLFDNRAQSVLLPPLMSVRNSI